MSRKPSPETQVRTLTRQCRELLAENRKLREETLRLQNTLQIAGNESMKWQQRFDQLLSKCEVRKP